MIAYYIFLYIEFSHVYILSINLKDCKLNKIVSSHFKNLKYLSFLI